MAENHDPAVIRKIAIAEIAAIFNIKLAHLSVGQFHSAHLQRNHARPIFERKVSIHFGAYRRTIGTSSRTACTSSNSNDTFFARALSARLHAGLSGHDHDHVVAHVHEGMQNAAAQSLPIGQRITTETRPHMMPSMVSTERSRLRVSACQLCEISSLKNTQTVELAGMQLSIEN